MWNKWSLSNVSVLYKFLNKWKSEEAEAHPSQTSQKSLCTSLISVYCLCSLSLSLSLLPFSTPLCFPISSQLVICSLIPPHSPSGRGIIIFLLLLVSHHFSLHRQKSVEQHYDLDGYICMCRMRVCVYVSRVEAHTSVACNVLICWELARDKLWY